MLEEPLAKSVNPFVLGVNLPHRGCLARWTSLVFTVLENYGPAMQPGF